MIGLTPKQAELLAFLKAEEAEGRTPTFQEMSDALALNSKGRIAALIEQLTERGYIERIPNRARCIRVLAEPMPFKPDPVLLANYEDGPLVSHLRQRGYRVERIA